MTSAQPQTLVSPANGNLLVTGASTGIGQACALHFAQLGYRVFAGVRKPADAEALEAQAPGNIKALLLDVTCPERIASAVTEVGDAPLAGLINNAGIAVVGPIELVPIEAWRRQFEVNVLGLVAVTQAFLPHLRRGPGRIVNIGSIAGRCAAPCSAPYDASKFAVEAITDALRMELHAWGIAVSVVEPGSVATPIWDKSLQETEDLCRRTEPDRYALYQGLMAKVRKMIAESARKAISTEAVVKAVEHALRAKKPKTRYPIGQDALLFLLLNRLPDRLRDRLILGEINR
ncbi:MAG TPA: SDR family oxidoreductase [Chthonomonadaceae bacterium]|nr:SDR family oxidoreductase [Chthonomonadaceae bacterium]